MDGTLGLKLREVSALNDLVDFFIVTIVCGSSEVARVLLWHKQHNEIKAENKT